MTNGMPASTVASSEFVVPKSIPTILLMSFPPTAGHRQKRLPRAPSMPGVQRGIGLKARHVTAWGEAPGSMCPNNLCALKGQDMEVHDFVTAYQALKDFVERVTWACARSARSSPGYNMTGLRS